MRRIEFVVVVGFPGDDRLFFEIESRRRRLRLPLETGGIPRIVGSRLAVTHRPEEVEHGQEIAHAENSGARGRENVEHLELRRILVIAARHAVVTKNELREERQVESDEDDEGGETRPAFRIELAGNFRPPEMHASEVSHERPADHDVVEVCDYEIGVMDMNVDAEGGQKQPGEAAHGEQANETEGVKHGSIVDRSLVKRGSPVEHFDGRGYGDGI